MQDSHSRGLQVTAHCILPAIGLHSQSGEFTDLQVNGRDPSFTGPFLFQGWISDSLV